MATKKSAKKSPAKPKVGRPALFGRPTAVLVKIDAGDLERIASMAGKAGVKVSTWIRDAAREKAGIR